MLFNSLEFIAFFIVFFSFWPLFKKKDNPRWIYIVAFSFLFYGWWDWRFLFLLIFTGLVDYVAAIWMEKRPGWRGILLYLSMFANLGTLFIFKYSLFVAESFDGLFSVLKLNIVLAQNIPDFALILPVGISFYTFQSMSYTIDVYRKEIPATKNIFHFFAFLSMFPQLVAGPIIRAIDLLPQLEKVPFASTRDKWEGMKLILSGFFKKMVLADNLAPMITVAFSKHLEFHGPFFWWLIISSFALQIYFDFSGYSDIARGIAKIMGYDFKLNFNYPYISKSLKEFWGRWHISLSTWFRDYVYISLGGNRNGPQKALLFMFVAMILSGIWHGAAWTFLLWGLTHTVFLGVERVTGWSERIRKYQFGSFISWLITLIEVLLAWVLFRSESFSQALYIFREMFNFEPAALFRGNFNILPIFVGAIIYEALNYILDTYSDRFNQKLLNIFEVIFYALVILTILFFRGAPLEFIYFQF